MNSNEDFNWLSHKGEMAQLIRKYDWASTPMGPVKNWPISLKVSLNLILNNGIAMSITWGKESIYFYNDAYKPILGGGDRHPTALGKSMAETWTEVWSTVVSPMHVKVKETREQIHFEDYKFVLQRNGFPEEAYFNFSYSPLYGDTQEVDGILTTCVETTKVHETREELRTSLNKLDTIVANLTEGLLFIDPAGNVIYMNPAALRINQFTDLQEFRYKAEQFAEFMDVYDLDGKLLPIHKWPMSRIVNGEKFIDYEVVIHRRDTDYTWVGSFSGIQVLNQNGSPLMSVMTVKNITSRKTIEIELKEALRARDEFLSIASHELRTPLTSLKMQLQLTNRGLRSEGKAIPSPEKIQKVIDISLKQVERLTTLIEDLLDVSRIQSGKLTHRFEPTLLKPLIHDLIERFHEQSIQTHTPIEFVTKVNPTLNCDPFRIDQVLTNLISNALKYASGKPIHVSLDADDKHVFIRVQDFGMGIAKDKIHLIFNRFERAAAETNISGLGLGLYITKSIVDAHHGTIQVDSELKQGTTFTVILPLA